MKAIIIMYEGTEIPDCLIEQVIMAASGLKSVSVMKLDDSEVARALISNGEHDCVEVPTTEQEAINHAAVYIAETVLKNHTDAIQVAIDISNRILSGDTKMRTAVEILATHTGTISDKRFTKSVMSVVNKIYKALQDNVL